MKRKQRKFVKKLAKALKVVDCCCGKGERVVFGLFFGARLLKILAVVGLNCVNCGKKSISKEALFFYDFRPKK